MDSNMVLRLGGTVGLMGLMLAKSNCQQLYCYILLRLPWLAPDITTAIIDRAQNRATHRPDIDAPDAAAAGKLGRTAKAPRLWLK